MLVRDYDLIKRAGYLHTDGLLSIPVDSIRREDKRRFEKAQSFINGETDSAKIAAFEEEKEFRINIYSRALCVPLFDAAEAFTHLPFTKKHALKDALAWAKRYKEWIPGRFSELIRKLEQKLSS
ncbi:MAG: hypothetical protein M9904_12055 [Chitinophagaceae bacterium]|nr:hypothetical protein [Chitinophagaceae bacterium]